jgi:hypothetical protein
MTPSAQATACALGAVPVAGASTRQVALFEEWMTASRSMWQDLADEQGGRILEGWVWSAFVFKTCVTEAAHVTENVHGVHSSTNQSLFT